MSANAAWPPSGRQWIFLAIGLVAIAAAFALDNAVTGTFYLPVHGPAWEVARGLSKYGDWPPILVAGLAVVAALAVARNRTTGRLFLLILVAGLLTGLGSTLIRSTSGRTRPTAPAPQGFYGPRYQGKWIIGKYDFGSFPSGHTATWAGLAGAAWFRRRSWGIGFLLAGVAVAWSRMALGCHHFSDVTASLVWGFIVGPWMVNRLEPAITALWRRAGLPPA